VVKGVKWVMCNAHDQDTCYYMSGEFTAMAAIRVAAKLCPFSKYIYILVFFFFLIYFFLSLYG
jgi:hypothetical protein